MTTDQAIEQEIQDKGLNAPRITPGDIEALIASETYFTVQDGILGAHPGFDPQPVIPEGLDQVTICAMTLQNGHRLIGVNTGPVSGGNFDADMGQRMARQHAVDQIWPLAGYVLRDYLHRTGGALVSAVETLAAAPTTSTATTDVAALAPAPAVKFRITFDEFIQYGINAGAALTNGIPWAFQYNGVPVTNENPNCYLVGASPTLMFTRGLVLVTLSDGNMLLETVQTTS